MEVILLKDVRNVGRKDEIKTVADGFAANFLLPQNLAAPATPEKIAAIEKAKVVQVAGIVAQETELDENLRALARQKIEISARATPTGGLFKSMTTADIARALKEQKNAAIPQSAILIAEPIKTTGDHTVALQSRNVKVEIIFSVVPIS